MSSDWGKRVWDRLDGHDGALAALQREIVYPALSRKTDESLAARMDEAGRYWRVFPLDVFDDLGAAAAAVAALSTVYAPIRLPVEHIASDQTLVANKAYVVDSGTGVRTETLPGAPTDGDMIQVLRSGANTVTLNRNGKNINGAAANYDITTTLTSKMVRYIASTTSWWTF